MKARRGTPLGHGPNQGRDRAGDSRAALSYLVAATPLVYLSVPYLTMTAYVLSVSAFALVVLLAELQGRGGRVAVRPLDLPVVLLFAWPLVTSLWSVDRSTTITQGTVVLVNLVLYYLITRQKIDDVIDTMTRICLLVPFFTGIVFVALLLAFGAIRSVDELVFYGAGSFSNHAGALVVAVVPFILFGSSFYPNRWLFRAAFVCAAFVVIASESRGAMLVFGLAVLLVVLLSRGRIKRRAVTLVLLGAGAFLGLFLVWAGTGIGMIMSTLSRLQESQLLSLGGLSAPSASGGDFQRTAMYFEGLRLIREHWLLGVGYGGLFFEMEASYGFGVVSHNLFISAVGEMGLPGLLILLWAVGGAIAQLLRARRNAANDPFLRNAATAALVSLIVVLVHSQFRPFYAMPMVGLLLGQAAVLGGHGRQAGAREGADGPRLHPVGREAGSER